MKTPFKVIIMGTLFSCIHRDIHFKEYVLDAHGPEWCWAKAAGDVNGDHVDDLLIGGYNSGGLWIYLSPDHAKKMIVNWQGVKTDAEIVDMDHDGDRDIVCLFDSAIFWFSNPGWEPHFIDSLVGHDLEAADLDGDGLIDLAARDQGEFNSRGDTLFLLKRMSMDQWETKKIMIPNGEGLKVSDLNGDGKPDLIVNGTWLENTGMIDRWESHVFANSWTWKNTYIDAGYINGDRRKDIVMSPSELAGNFYRLSWFEQGKDPKAPWTEHKVVDSIESVIHFVGLADFNLDGKEDIAYAEMKQGAYPHEVVVMLQGEDFWIKKVISTGGSHSMRITDIDGDGDPDLYGANWQEDTVKYWINDTR